ncbi:MAG: hypothetical protein RJA22_2000 [Verrucomicrobiota bacterium]|jgi:putative membrane-bound dehydrogenase-like protein
MPRAAFPAVLVLLAGLACTPAASYRPDVTKPLGFPIYTNQPPGRQLDNDPVRKAVQDPPLDPESSRKTIQVPAGFEVRLFASEPEVVNPVAMAWDDRGRLWVVELYEYPRGARPGEKGRDRIKILEDTDADGRADKVTVFADGFSLATGLALGNGGAYLGVAPDLLFLEDTDGDDRADRRTVLKTGFGLEDRHELLNGFAWGPDGWLYMTHGVFTHSKVRDPNNPDDDGVRMDAALARYHPRTRRFEVFADGTSNPWGVDWNERGDAFVSACVIQHLFHMAPGGLYNRQGGTWPNPFGYVQDLPSKGLPAIVDWRHFRAAHAGICIYQGNQWPADWRGLVLLGNIHESALNCDRLSPVGATYKAERETRLLGPPKGDYQVDGGTFLASGDHWFRPVSSQTGPDGAVWVMDWCDKYPCYQNAQADPEGVDRELGRIWRVVWTGPNPGQPVPSRPDPRMDLAKLDNGQLVELLRHPNVWQRRHAIRLLGERADAGSFAGLDRVLYAGRRDRMARPPLEQRLAAFSALHAANLLTPETLDQAAGEPHPELRAWAARFTGERAGASPADLRRLARLAADDDTSVRAAVATALRQLTSGSLTINSAPPTTAAQADLNPLFQALLARPGPAGDFYYPHIVWMALEPRAAANPEPALALASAQANPVSAYCLRRLLRRVADLTDPAARTRHLNAAFTRLGELAGQPLLAEAALDGLIDAFRGKGQPPTVPLEPIFQKLTANPALADKARRLATLLGDTSASRTLIAKINDPAAPAAERLRGITAAREAKDDTARNALLNLLRTGQADQSVLREGLRAIGAFGGDDIAYVITDAWKKFDLPTRRAASEVLVLRSKWSRALLAAVDQKTAQPGDISATARRALAHSQDATVVDHANRVLGHYRATGTDKLQLIAAKRKVVLAAEPDLRNGHEVARRACLVCHKLHGEGAEVGPDLTGVGRSNLDALLHNVIDPNEVVGNGNESTTVELKDGSVLTGRIVENSPSRLKLLASGPVEHVIPRDDIAVEAGQPKVTTSQFSLMPEGLEAIPDKDFRDLIWFILNPPSDQRPWTKELRRELIGDEAPAARRGERAAQPPVDLESVALWNPDWQVNCPPFEGAPAKLVEHLGRRNVLMTHPVSRETSSTLERSLAVPAAGATLSVAVAAHDQGDWELRVRVNNQVIHRQVINHDGERWKTVRVPLDRWKGQTVKLRLDNAATDWSWEFAYWSDLQVR